MAVVIGLDRCIDAHVGAELRHLALRVGDAHMHFVWRCVLARKTTDVEAFLTGQPQRVCAVAGLVLCDFGLLTFFIGL